MALGHFLNDFHMSWLGPLLPLLVVQFHLNLARAGLLGTILITSSALSQPLFGLAADRLRRNIFAGAGPALTALAMGLSGILPTYAVLVLVLLFAGIGTAAFHPQAAALAGFISGARRVTGLSIFVAGGELAFALGPLYIAAVLQSAGLSATPFAALPGFLAAIVLAVVIQRWPTPHAPARGTLGAALADQRRMLFFLWIFVVLRSIVVVSFLTFLPLLLRQRGLSLVMGGAAVFLFGGIGAIGGILGGVLADRIGRRAVLALSFIVPAPLLALYLQMPVGWGLLLLPLAGIIVYTSAPVAIVMAQEGLPHHASVASSIVMGLAWGIGGLSLTAVGAAADAVGLETTLQVVLVIFVVGLLPVAAIPRRSVSPVEARVIGAGAVAAGEAGDS